MRLACVLLLACVTTAGARAQERERVTVAFEGASLLEVVQTLREETGQAFLFNHDELRRVTGVTGRWK